MVATRGAMENRMDAVELRVGSLEGSVKKIFENMEAFHAEFRDFTKRKSIATEEEDEFSPGASGVTSPRVKSGGYDHQWRSRGRKLEIPVCKGEDAHGWLVRVERYFRVNEVKEAEKLDAVVIAMEERALNWFQWWEEQATKRTWSEFQTAVLQRFNPGAFIGLLGPLLKLKQEGSIAEDRDNFELHVAPLKKEERTLLPSIFRNGLKDEIQAELKLFKIDDLAELMDQALIMEEKHHALFGKGGGTKEKGDAKDKTYIPKFRGT